MTVVSVRFVLSVTFYLMMLTALVWISPTTTRPRLRKGIVSTYVLAPIGPISRITAGTTGSSSSRSAQSRVLPQSPVKVETSASSVVLNSVTGISIVNTPSVVMRFRLTPTLTPLAGTYGKAMMTVANASVSVTSVKSVVVVSPLSTTVVCVVGAVSSGLSDRCLCLLVAELTVMRTVLRKVLRTRTQGRNESTTLECVLGADRLCLVIVIGSDIEGRMLCVIRCTVLTLVLHRLSSLWMCETAMLARRVCEVLRMTLISVGWPVC